PRPSAPGNRTVPTARRCRARPPRASGAAARADHRRAGSCGASPYAWPVYRQGDPPGRTVDTRRRRRMVPGMQRVGVVAAVRTPIGKFLGALSGLSAVELGTAALRAAIARAGVQPAEVEEVIFGHARQLGS